MKNEYTMIGYKVSCPKIPQGRFFKTYDEALQEMERQMANGATNSGITEIYEKKSILIETEA